MINLSYPFLSKKWEENVLFYPIHNYIQKSCLENPDVVAVKCGKEKLTYRKLDEFSNKIASYLKGQITCKEKEVRVGLLGDNSLLTAPALLGILKSSCTYVPISRAFPLKRIEYIVKDAGISILLSPGKNEMYYALKSSMTIIDINDILASDLLSEEIFELDSNSNSAAYVLYTSGTTGEPKGVIVEHRSLCYYLYWHCLKLRADTGQIDLPLTSSLSFAAAVTQFYTPLLLGKTLHIIPEDIIRQPDLLFDWYQNNKGFGLYCVPTLWEELVSFAEVQASKNIFVTSPDCVLLSGEKATHRLIDRSYYLWPNINMWNLYGPTEATANVAASMLRPNEPIIIGDPIPGCNFYILNENLKPVNVGNEGELFVSGPLLARGYNNKPELTRQKFLTNPFSDDLSRIYGTGDRVMVNENGTLLFLGRKDAQIKIRGYRVEIAEIEACLEKFQAISQGIVSFYATSQKIKELVAYIKFLPYKYATITEIRDFLLQYLPEYMIPNRYVIVNYFEKLANGKINYKRLPAPGQKRPDLGYAINPPTNVLEKEWVQLWQNILQIEEIGVDDNFFDLGCNSLTIISASRQIEKLFGLKFTYENILSNPSCRQLIKFIKSRKVVESVTPIVFPKMSAGNSPQLSFGQKSLWFLQTTVDSPAYNIRFSIHFKGNINQQDLNASIAKVINRHEPLRTRFVYIKGEITAVIEQKPNIQLQIKDMRDAPQATRETIACGNAAMLCTSTRFDMTNGPLIKFVLYKLGVGDHILFVFAHHAIFDGYSINIFCNDLFSAYSGTNVDYELEPKIRFSDFASWQHKVFSGVGHDQSKIFWAKELKNAMFQLEVPYDFTRPAIQSHEGSYEKISIKGGSLERLVLFNKEHSVTSFITLIAVFKLLLFRYTNQPDLLIGCPVANRQSGVTDNLVGFFSNIIILRSELKTEGLFAQLINKVKEAYIRSLEYQSFPFEKLLELIAPARGPERPPLFQVMFAYHGKLNSKRVEENLFCNVSEYPSPGSKFDLCMDVFEKEYGLDLTLTYNETLYKAATINRILKQFEYLFNEVTIDCNKNLGDYKLQPAHEFIGCISQSNETTLPYSINKTIPELFEIQALANPSRFAISWNDKRLTYNQLKNSIDNRANDFRLQRIKKNMFIGVCMEHDIDMVITLMAILKLGACYVPLDPYYPLDRLKYIIEDSRVEKIIVSPAFSTLLSTNRETILVSNYKTTISSFDVPKVSINTTDLAYIMYTSGSTGQPKGVLVPHKGVINFLQWMRNRFGFSQNNKILSKTSINFDISVWELFVPLISGAELILAKREELQVPELLASIIAKHQVTDIQFVPSALKALVSSGLLGSCSSLRRIFSGGEMLSLLLQEEVFESFKGELHNLYGPTEASIYVCHWQCRSNANLRLVPIGKAIPNTSVFVLDNSLNPVPPGVIGEIYIGGVAVANGYWQLEETTSKKFIVDPFSDNPKQKLFKTGDLGRYLGDGNIEFLGRFDHQVKVRGYRIELSEIEHRLNNHPEVKHAIVIVKQYKNDDIRLVAYLLYKDNSGPTYQELRAYLKIKLPMHMIPSDFVTLDSIPLLPNNKIDYNALPPPQFIKKLNGELEKVYENEEEKIISAIWKQILQKDNFDIDDNFFEVGGHSLLVLQLRNFIKEKLNKEISNIDIFQYPTIKSMSSFLREHQTLDVKVSELSIRNALKKTSFIQKNINRNGKWNQ